MFLAQLMGALATSQPPTTLPRALFPSIPQFSRAPEWVMWLHGAAVALGVLVLGMLFVWSMCRTVQELRRKVDDWCDWGNGGGSGVASAPVCACSANFVPGIQNSNPGMELCVVCALEAVTQSLQLAERHLSATRTIIAEISSAPCMRPSQHTCDNPHE